MNLRRREECLRDLVQGRPVDRKATPSDTPNRFYHMQSLRHGLGLDPKP
jgi:hypothetical protein